jgi:hypothetical protein
VSAQLAKRTMLNLADAPFGHVQDQGHFLLG